MIRQLIHQSIREVAPMCGRCLLVMNALAVLVVAAAVVVGRGL